MQARIIASLKRPAKRVFDGMAASRQLATDQAHLISFAGPLQSNTHLDKDRLTTLKNTIAAAALLLVAVSTSLAADADFSQCRQMFANSQLPVLQNQAMAPRALCYSSFAVLHSGKSRTPIYVAERLNKEQLETKVTRGARFFADARLPRAERAELEDYKNSGMDRRHMTNMVPQYPVNNRKAWASIEKATRKYVMRATGDVFVVTGPVFKPNHPTIGSNKVWVSDGVCNAALMAKPCIHASIYPSIFKLRHGLFPQ